MFGFELPQALADFDILKTLTSFPAPFYPFPYALFEKPCKIKGKGDLVTCLFIPLLVDPAVWTLIITSAVMLLEYPMKRRGPIFKALDSLGIASLGMMLGHYMWLFLRYEQVWYNPIHRNTFWLHTAIFPNLEFIDIQGIQGILLLFEAVIGCLFFKYLLRTAGLIERKKRHTTCAFFGFLVLQFVGGGSVNLLYNFLGGHNAVRTGPVSNFPWIENTLNVIDWEFTYYWPCYVASLALHFLC